MFKGIAVGILGFALVFGGCMKNGQVNLDIDRYKPVACWTLKQATVEVMERHSEAHHITMRVVGALKEFVEGSEGAALKGELVQVAEKELAKHPEVTDRMKVMIMGLVTVAESELAELLERENAADRIPPVVREYAEFVLGCIHDALMM